jgi:hypothetical protein
VGGRDNDVHEAVTDRPTRTTVTSTQTTQHSRKAPGGIRLPGAFRPPAAAQTSRCASSGKRAQIRTGPHKGTWSLYDTRADWSPHKQSLKEALSELAHHLREGARVRDEEAATTLEVYWASLNALELERGKVNQR